MAKKYSQSAGWMREIWALAIFVGGFTLYDWQEGGENERILALLMMFGAGIFLCFALVERMFFIPRIRSRQDPADAVEMTSLGDVARNESVNYDGPRTAPRSVMGAGASGGGASPAGPDGLDPVPPPHHFHHDETAAETELEADLEADSEDDHESRAALESALSDPFFANKENK